MNINNYSHIIWDWNGTLLDDIDLCLQVINNLLENRSLPIITRGFYLDVFGFPVEDYYQKLGFNFDREPFESVSTEFITAYENGRTKCRLMPGARATLETLISNGFSQSIISASKQTYLKQAVFEYDIQSHFNSINGLDNHHAAGKSGIAKQYLMSQNHTSLLLIGDTLHDAEIASILAIDCWLIPNGHQSRHRLNSAKVPLLDSVHDIMDIILKQK